MQNAHTYRSVSTTSLAFGNVLQPGTQLVAACCAWPPTPARAARIDTAIKALPDWGGFWEDVQRHRVIPAVYAALKDHPSLPPSLHNILVQETRISSMWAMRQTQETLKIDAVLRDRAIHPLFFKGLTLGQRAFGSLTMKTCHDIDLYVRADRAAEAIAVLEEAGYRFLKTRRLTNARLRDALVRHWKDIELISPSGVLVELHWRLTKQTGLLKQFEPEENARPISFDGHTGGRTASVDTFGDVDLLCYLGAHGALHNWARLKWLADLSALACAMHGPSLDAAMMRAAAQGADRALAQGFTLAHHLLGANLPATLPFNHPIVRIALSRMEQPVKPPTPIARYRWGISNTLAWWHLYARARDAVRELGPDPISHSDIVAMPLPRQLDWIYLVVRLPLWIARQICWALRVFQTRDTINSTIRVSKDS